MESLHPHQAHSENLYTVDSGELESVLTAFTAGLLLITVSELGDKTFFIAMCLAMRHRRRYVFAGAVLALAAMTILSVSLGRVVSLLPRDLTHYAAIVLFVAFGIKLLYDAHQMRPECSDRTLAADDDYLECASDAERDAIAAISQAEVKLKKKTPFAICLEAFGLVFVGEWGDRTQFATIALAAAHNPVGVTLGAIAGHTICAAIAVIGGKLIAGRISERTVTQLGGILFLLFAGVAWFEGT
ncbi:TMEM165/GDT1 family protein [Phormidesmis priestleyi]|uniref:TMEM165/GDT1 family protein n=1 Tax=Phormidesmis priestleyi TaxID=268141 RepID=UPI00295003D1|nr:TMEM165/GDT1 family protein [Phormidesmis priestleyi]